MRQTSYICINGAGREKGLPPAFISVKSGFLNLYTEYHNVRSIPYFDISHQTGPFPSWHFAYVAPTRSCWPDGGQEIASPFTTIGQGINGPVVRSSLVSMYAR